MTCGSELETLKDCLQSLLIRSMPAAWDDAFEKIEQESAHFDKILAAGTAPIYGANTRVGHRDHEQLSDVDIQTFQHDFLASHTLGGPPWYSAHTTRCISYAKMYSLAAGGSGISTSMYHKAASASVFNPTVKPLIPMHCTYSCGDVIPGAHWAKFVLDNFPHYEPRAGEVMALLNGSFVHVGYTLSLTRSLERLGALLIETTRLSSQLVQANSVNFSAPCKPHSQRIVQHITQSLSVTHTDYRYQDPVSVRASPQIIETFVDAVRSLYQQLDYQLKSPSNNPLFSLETDHPLSQASFLAPTLSIKTEAVIEAILFALWASVNRTQYLLSGKASTIPQDGANPGSALQFIQMPKLMMSILERCRQQLGRRVFAAGAQTSNGIEDLWTYGVNTTEQLETLCSEGIHLLATELYVLMKCAVLFGDEGSVDDDVVSAVLAEKDSLLGIEKLTTLLDSGMLSSTGKLLSEELFASYD